MHCATVASPGGNHGNAATFPGMAQDDATALDFEDIRRVVSLSLERTEALAEEIETHLANAEREIEQIRRQMALAAHQD